MKNTDVLLNGALRALLNEKLSDAEVQSLKDEGFTLKNRKRSVAVMIALYKKAASGDLSAIKELRSIVADEESERSIGKAVILIDDIKDKDVTNRGQGI
ncbi:MAG: hypothetical protein PUF48_01240 [Oscillospiraceae bacterium]|nr:hypothetical protein [Oscillospiraceae bacterium]